ncbi:MAG TPA: cobalamin biosynthesis protein [Streptosporangiaceae bacterium]|nr:cobalamin biosynthesis protein [Streptosporangiaceae bacterium]
MMVPSRPGSARAAGLLAGGLLDLVLGDPRRGHPVAAFGTAAARAETVLWSDSRGRGAAMVLACVAPVAGAGLATQRLARGRPAVALAATALASWAVLGGASLGGAALALGRALDAGDLAAARRMLPTLCGRDPAPLGAAGLARAAVESVAENTSDAVVAPLLWGAAFGLPGLLGYRAVNTLDAMIGQRSPRYQRFGWAAARLDDVANLVPARVTGLLAVVLAPTVGGSSRRALGTLLRDGRRHPSPNAGQCEAAFAGALGVRLGGPSSYQGRAEQRGLLGDGRPAAAPDISRAVRLSRLVSAAALVLAVIVAWRRN